MLWNIYKTLCLQNFCIFLTQYIKWNVKHVKVFFPVHFARALLEQAFLFMNSGLNRPEPTEVGVGDKMSDQKNIEHAVSSWLQTTPNPVGSDSGTIPDESDSEPL